MGGAGFFFPILWGLISWCTMSLRSPAGLSTRKCTVKLDEEMSNYAGLGQESRFGSA
jgi:hypothetical protein